MRTINILPIEEIESLMMDKVQLASVLITSKQEMSMLEELCDYYGYMFAHSSVGTNVKQIVMRVSGGGQ